MTGASEKDLSLEEKEAIECKRIKEDRELKDNLIRRYSGYICSLKHEFSKSKKKKKLPEEAKQILLAWWNIHFKWPYPTVINHPFHHMLALSVGKRKYKQLKHLHVY